MSEDDVVPVAARVKVNLSQRSVDALEFTAALTGDTRTEVTNKAIQTYHDVQEAQHGGGFVALQPDADSDPVVTVYY